MLVTRDRTTKTRKACEWDQHSIKYISIFSGHRLEAFVRLEAIASRFKLSKSKLLPPRPLRPPTCNPVRPVPRLRPARPHAERAEPALRSERKERKLPSQMASSVLYNEAGGQIAAVN